MMIFKFDKILLLIISISGLYSKTVFQVMIDIIRVNLAHSKYVCHRLKTVSELETEMSGLNIGILTIYSEFNVSSLKIILIF